MLDSDIDVSTRELLQRFHFDERNFAQLRKRLIDGEARDDVVKGVLAPPEASDIVRLPALGSAARHELAEVGREALANGEVCTLVLAGGMGTRFGGQVKAAVDVLSGHTFLDLKLRDLERRGRRAQVQLPVLIMTSFATDREIARMVAQREPGALALRTFPQFISLRLEPSGALWRDAAGRLSPYAPGHGDMVYAMKQAGLLEPLRAQGVRYLFMSNVDNLAATLEPAVLGAHVQSAAAITFEVAPLQPGDQGGVPARLDGHLQVIEALRLPRGFASGSIPWFSINTMTFTLAALEADLTLDWFCVRKQVQGRVAVQFERLVNQLTARLPSRALAVDREGADGRFLPVKDPQELALRLPSIRALLERGVP